VVHVNAGEFNSRPCHAPLAISGEEEKHEIYNLSCNLSQLLHFFVIQYQDNVGKHPHTLRYVSEYHWITRDRVCSWLDERL